MSIDKCSTLQVVRYKTAKLNIEKDQLASILKEKLIEHKITDIDKEPIESTNGWVDIKDNYITKFDSILFDNFDEDSVRNDLICMTMRIDTKKVSKHVLKKEVNKRINEMADELNKSQITELGNVVYEELLLSIKAEPKCFDVIWKIDQDIVYFCSTSKKANEEFETLFNITFGTKLECLIPFVNAERKFESGDIENISPCEFK